MAASTSSTCTHSKYSCAADVPLVVAAALLSFLPSASAVWLLNMHEGVFQWLSQVVHGSWVVSEATRKYIDHAMITL